MSEASRALILEILSQGRIDVAEAVELLGLFKEGPAAANTVSPRSFRLCLRLQEPSDAASPWQLVGLLQGLDDLSLILPLAVAWDANHEGGALLHGYRDQVGQKVRQDLDQARQIWSALPASANWQTLESLPLDTAEAHYFLSVAPALKKIGLGIMVPAWAGHTRARIKARPVAESGPNWGGGWLRKEDVVRFEWQVAVDDKRLTTAELELLAQAKAPLVSLRGQWMELGQEQLAAARRLFQDNQQGQVDMPRLVQEAVGGGERPPGIEYQELEGRGGVEKMLAGLSGQMEYDLLDLPEGFQGQLRPYQQRGYSWLAFLRQWGLGACLADDMGLGKTPQTLALIQRDWESGQDRPVLLICPTSVVDNWRREGSRFTPDLPLLVHHGSNRAQGAAFRDQAAQCALVISSYALLQRDLESLEQVDWAGIVLDEAQNIKNPDTKQARGVRSLAADYRIALTGTPVENNIGELWSIMEFLNPGLLGSRRAFWRQFYQPVQVRGEAAAAARLKARTGPFVLRRLKTDAGIAPELPDKMEMKVWCPLTREQTSLYSAVVRESMDGLGQAGGMRRRGLILATLAKLRQICNHPAQLLKDGSSLAGRSGKLIRLGEMLEEALANGERALIFTQYAAMGHLLQSHLENTLGWETLFLHGGVAKKQRDAMVNRFQEELDGPPIFLLSLKAGGTGLNLVRATQVFHFDRWWNPAVENQATDRAFRIGQGRRVQVYKYLCAGTVEEKMDEILERKQALAERVVGQGEEWLTELSSAELKELFTLRKEQE
ncbi:MAG: ATP-dependent helicase [Candidatus Latescibacteria bacterium]|nr:ATP-dependent helicase [Candidatus Latescibacterota bacterium]